MRGRTPQSPEMRKLRGAEYRRVRKESDEYRRMRQASDDRQEPGEDAPPCAKAFSAGWDAPAWLPAGAKEVWRQALPIALRETKLQESALQVFAAYCDAVYRLQRYSRVVEAEGAIYTTASGYVRKRPEVEMRDKAAHAVRNLASDLNLTPKSWIGSMGTYAGRQLDMFMNGGRATAPEATALEDQADGQVGYLGRRPELR